MKSEHAEEFTAGLGQVLAGAVRLAELAPDLGVPQALGLSPEEWAQRRLTGAVRLSIKERRKVVPELLEQGLSQREVADALGVHEATVSRDLADASKTDAIEPPPLANASEQNGRDLGALFTTERDDWETPQDLFDQLNAEFRFELDVCATDRTAKCSRYFTPADDGLAQDWRGSCWMNPPYGEAIGKWVAKAAAAARDNATTVVCLVPARVDTGWWWDHCRHGEIRFLRGRLHFDGGSTGAPFPSAVVILGRPARVVWWER